MRPVTVRKIDNRWRVVEGFQPLGGKQSPTDGGGFDTERDARALAARINEARARKG